MQQLRRAVDDLLRMPESVCIVMGESCGSNTVDPTPRDESSYASPTGLRQNKPCVWTRSPSR